jgi:DNA-binding transcriptional LysR family regulator
MSIRLLKTLISIAEQGTFTAAAESVHITHAAVSQQMKALEEELNVAIFDRSKRIPKLTPIGLELVSKSRELVNSYNNLVPSILGDEFLSGELKLGAVPTALTGLVPFAMTQLREEYNALHIHVIPGLSTELISEVERGGLDAAIVTKPERLSANLVWRQIAEEPLELLAAISVDSNDPVHLLKTKPFIRFSRRAIVGGMIDQWLQQKAIDVDERMELENLESISSMVYCDLGVSIVPKGCVESPNPLPIKRIPLGEPAVYRQVGLISKNDTIKTRILDALNSELIKATLKGKLAVSTYS